MVSKRIRYEPLGTLDGIVVVQDEFCAIMTPEPHEPL
jgi:hypothetical protein